MIERFTCRDFRNLEPLDWRPEPGAQLVVGANGAGKTSLLEAIYMVATTRSFRRSRPAECCRRGADAFHLATEVGGQRRVRLELGWSAGEGTERRLNGKAAALSEHLAVQPVVAWSEAEGDLLDGPPELRRRLLDQGVVAAQPGALETLARYRQALEQKRRLLVDGGPGLGAWNELLAVAAAELITLRRGYAEKLAAALAGVLESAPLEGALESGSVELDYRPSPGPGEGGAGEVLAAIEERRSEERRQGRVLVGPHRDDLDVLWQGRGLRRAASAGEKKLLGLAMSAARGKVLEAAGRRPVYLLDDADGDLDRQRLRAAWGLFGGAGQLIATSHRPEAWGALEGVPRGRLVGGRLAFPADL